MKILADARTKVNFFQRRFRDYLTDHDGFFRIFIPAEGPSAAEGQKES